MSRLTFNFALVWAPRVQTCVARGATQTRSQMKNVPIHTNGCTGGCCSHSSYRNECSS
ncbi:hypothetical protein PF005_g22572 [Phytophthora fragariae]|uniref:Uncharacterized protein n=1 Tax=Phytophthora fragariae TaxID=53985 RepID=A0A6A3DX65_9STRA|nr:hypothetical protein PF003_g31400 [Phytophthora fragariae]KAE8926344.1 hypothetical protein PF009_g23461 [Phytophthora fragariae]KAE8983439.1 hypothetical protein PF011_g21183 [Phytophthora fragariae]KAE9081633.1 hypothetical protein PF007_g22582 [Phytophthora fragariae]KAE9082194.1 hypothetical protein PF010_g21686 [Phytophthora fragariae]